MFFHNIHQTLTAAASNRHIPGACLRREPQRTSFQRQQLARASQPSRHCCTTLLLCTSRHTHTHMHSTNAHIWATASVVRCNRQVPRVTAHLGVSASVHRGNFVCGGNSHSVHSKHGVTPGRMTRAWPLKPSVPPSTRGLIVDISGSPSSSNSASHK